MLIRNTLILTGLALMLISCQSTPQTQCDQKDWYEEGRQQGLVGQAENTDPLKRRPACSTESTSADILRYRGGHAAGLISYCSPANGFEVGFDREVYQGVCPQQLEEDFLQGFKRGEQARRLREGNKALEIQILSVEQQMRELINSNKKSDLAEKKLNELRVERQRREQKINSLRKSL